VDDNTTITLVTFVIEITLGQGQDKNKYKILKNCQFVSSSTSCESYCLVGDIRSNYECGPQNELYLESVLDYEMI
jgi:hypothetical protein